MIDGLRVNNIVAPVCGRGCRASCRAFHDELQAPSHLAGGLGELVVADDREHPLCVDRGDVRVTVSLVDDDVGSRDGLAPQLHPETRRARQVRGEMSAESCGG